MDGRFRDAVHVDQLRTPVAVDIEPGFSVCIQGLAAEDNQAEGQSPVFAGVLFGRDELAKGGGGLVENRDPLAAEKFVERPGRPAGQVRDDYDSAAIRSPPHSSHTEKSEGIGVEQGPDVFWAEMEQGRGLTEQPHHIRVGDQDAFRPPGGARRVNHVGKVVGSRRAGRVAGTLPSDMLPVPVQADRLGRVRRQLVPQPPCVIKIFAFESWSMKASRSVG